MSREKGTFPFTKFMFTSKPGEKYVIRGTYQMTTTPITQVSGGGRGSTTATSDMLLA